MAKIIGLHGGAGHGKDTAMEEFVRMHQGRLHTHSMAFADELKKLAAIVFGVNVGRFYDSKKEVCPIWGITYRDMLQKFGTDFARNMIDDNFWVKKLAIKMDSLIEGRSDGYWDIVFITDVRFENEANWIRGRGGLVIEVHRPDIESELVGEEATHESENKLPLDLVDAVILNNGTKANLAESLEAALNKFEIIT